MLEGIRMIVLLVSLFLCAWIDWKTERVSVPLLLLGGMTAVLLHLFAQEESVFYLMTGMSVGIVLLLYSLVTHESLSLIHIWIDNIFQVIISILQCTCGLVEVILKKRIVFILCIFLL